MSRSYKHTPVFACKRRHAKKRANRKVRQRGKAKTERMKSGKSNAYKRVFETWDICDYRSWGGFPETKESGRTRRSTSEIWQKLYRRK